ncbi:MAG: DctP family TRAP transporter solute-binding subunit [Elusimicrobiota bacterium]
MRISALPLCALPFLAASSAAAEPPALTLSLAHGASKDHVYQFGAERFGEALRRETRGRMRLEIFPDGRRGGEGAAGEAVRLGDVDIAVLSAGAMSQWVPLLEVLDMPYLFRDRAHAYRVLDGEIGGRLNREVEKAGFVNLAYWEIGERELTNDVRPIATPQDIVDLPIRTAPNDVDISLLKAWGARPVPVDFKNLYDALARDEAAGQENPLTTVKSMRFYETQRYLSMTAHSHAFALVVMNRERFQALDAAAQRSLKKAAALAAGLERADARRQESEALSFLRKQGMIVTQPDVRSFQEASRAVYGDMINEVPSYLVDGIRNAK